jgi:hypothetical protein
VKALGQPVPPARQAGRPAGAATEFGEWLGVNLAPSLPSDWRRDGFGNATEFNQPALKSLLDCLGIGDRQGVLGRQRLARPILGLAG